jgi:hypothetical protein
LLGQDVLALVTRATAGRVNLGSDKPSLDEMRLPLSCPAEFEPLFRSLTEHREFEEAFVKSTPPIIGHTYLTPDFTVGSINRGDLWNQRRPLVAYWGSAQNPAFLRIRFLHDNYDFTAAQFFSVQKEGRILAGINFATDGGDRHPSLDRIRDGTIRAQDLRLRFEFGGAASKLPLSTAGEPRALTSLDLQSLSKLHLQIGVPFARWGKLEGRWENGTDSTTAWLDMVFYSGPAKEFRLAELDPAAVALTVVITPGDFAPPAKSTLDQDRIKTRWGDLELDIPTTPMPQNVLQKSARTRAR